MILGLDIAPLAFGVAFAGVAVGAAVQRLSGQAFGMIASPLVAIVAPQHLPATLLMLGLFVGMSATAFDVSAVDKRALPAGFAGRALGAILAAMIAATLIGLEGGIEWIRVLIACVVLSGVALSLIGASVAITNGTLFTAGLTAGVMGTLTAVGAPPMALLYQHEPAKRSRAMQNLFFFFGMAVSIPALAWQGLVRVDDMLFAALLAPGAVIGILASVPISRHTDKRRIRPAALGFSTASAIVLLIGVML